MVVLSAAICNRQGQVLVSRQFVSMSRIRIEGLLSAFPKLLNSEAHSKQHTFVETDEIRYVYQPMDTLFVLLLTNKNSNILSDLQTLRLLAKLVPEYCTGHDEEAVIEHSFELIFAFDEVVSLGHRENVDMNQIRTFMDMDSHEEKLHQIIERSKIEEAQEKAKEQAKKIRDDKINHVQLQGFGSDRYNNDVEDYQFNNNNDRFTNNDNDRFTNRSTNNYGGFNSGNKSDDDSDKETKTTTSFKRSKKTKKARGGMSLSKKGKSKQDDFIAQLAKQEETQGLSSHIVSSRTAQKQVANEEEFVREAIPVRFNIEEKVHAKFDRDGSLQKFQVGGSLNICIIDPDFTRVRINLGEPEKMQIKANSKLNKKKWEKQRICELKDCDENPFPLDSSSGFNLLKWRMKGKPSDEDLIPIKFTFWVEADDSGLLINAEYEWQGKELRDVSITIPNITAAPETENCDGDAKFDRREKELTWYIGDVNEDCSEGNLECTIPAELEEEDIFPISLNFSSETLYSGLTIEQVTQVEDDENVEFSVQQECRAEKVEIVA